MSICEYVDRVLGYFNPDVVVQRIFMRTLGRALGSLPFERVKTPLAYTATWFYGPITIVVKNVVEYGPPTGSSPRDVFTLNELRIMKKGYDSSDFLSKVVSADLKQRIAEPFIRTLVGDVCIQMSEKEVVLPIRLAHYHKDISFFPFIDYSFGEFGDDTQRLEDVLDNDPFLAVNGDSVIELLDRDVSPVIDHFVYSHFLPKYKGDICRFQRRLGGD